MKLFVGNLPHSYTDADLKQLFSAYSSVESARIITDGFTGKSRGFGFVELSQEDGQNAIAEIHNTEVGGRVIVVNEAHPPRKREGGGFGGREGGRGGPGGDRRGGREGGGREGYAPKSNWRNGGGRPQ